MRFSTVTILAALSSVALSQSLNDLPKCAQTCFGSNYGSCNPLDIKCICSNSSLINGIGCCVAGSCSAADQQTTIKFAVQLCQAQGVSVPTSASCASSSASSTGSATASGASGASSASGSTTPTAAGASTARSTALAPMQTAGAGIGMGLAVAGLLAAL